MFHWVTAVLNTVERFDIEPNVQASLTESSDELNKHYLKLLQQTKKRFKREERHLLREILTWAATADRPLRLSEVARGIELSYGLRFSRRGNIKLSSPRETLQKCSGFLSFNSLDGEERMNLVHDTFRKFVTDPYQCDSEFLIELGDANAYIAASCLVYLSEVQITPTSSPLDLPKAVLRYDHCSIMPHSTGQHIYLDHSPLEIRKPLPQQNRR